MDALMARCKATNKYSIYALSHYLTRESDGTVVVDRAKAIQTKDDERQFCVMLNATFLWGYRNWKCVTAWMETDGTKVIGGVYNLCTKERETRRVIATEIGKGRVYNWSCASYDHETLLEIARAIQNTP